MTLPEAAKGIAMSDQTLRVWIQTAGKDHPFGMIIREGERKSYYINEAKYWKFKRGEI